jgi:hypothetical protein
MLSPAEMIAMVRSEANVICPREVIFFEVSGLGLLANYIEET